MAQYFASQLRPSQQTTQSLRARQYKSSYKRRRDEDSDDPLDPAESSSGDHVDIPPPPFPHAPLKAVSNIPSNSKIQESIAALDPAVYAVHATSKNDAVAASDAENPALSTSHLHVLTTVMHRCLLEGDYYRASRAWGLLLRTKVAGGRHIDPRNHGRWGIGAELLLRRRLQSTSTRHRHENSPHEEEEEEDDDDGDDEHVAFSEDGLALARGYYDRFVIHYNHRRWLPNAVDNRIFYPPLFTIWIMDILDQSERSRKQIQKDHGRMSSVSIDSDGDMSGVQTDAHKREAAVQAEELSNARKLCERLDSLMNGPPYDKLPNWLCLRANVALWISDLLVGKGETGGHVMDADLSDDDDGHTFSSGSKRSRTFAKSISELNEALIYFERAEENGAGNMDVARSSIEIKIKSLTKQMAKFEG